MSPSATPMRPATTPVPVQTLGEHALRYLGLDPANPVTVVLALLARKYDLDPLLNEVAVIRTGQGLRPYITRDGLLQISHRSGQLDGIVVDDLHEGETGWGATVSVWRKDMSHPFTYSAGCGRHENQAKQGHGPEMAIARAERRALHRAFAIPTSTGDLDEDGDEPAVPSSRSGEGVAASRVPPGITRPGAATPDPDEPEPDDETEPTTLSVEAMRALALLASRRRDDKTTDVAKLTIAERANLERFLADVAEGIATVEQIDDTRWQMTGPGPGGGQRWVYWVDVDHQHIDAAPLDDGAEP